MLETYNAFSTLARESGFARAITFDRLFGSLDRGPSLSYHKVLRGCTENAAPVSLLQLLNTSCNSSVHG